MNLGQCTHGQVVAQGKQLSSLVGKIVYQFGIFTIPAIVCHLIQ
jgi:hypothetical protein